MPQVTIPNYNPPLEGSRSAAVYADTELAAGLTEVNIIIGALVPLRRQTEIFAAIDLLANGIRDRNLLEDQFSGAALVTAVNIDAITSTNRRTASDLITASFADTDVAISMGATATGAQHKVMLDTAIETMKKVLLETFKNQAA